MKTQNQSVSPREIERVEVIDIGPIGQRRQSVSVVRVYSAGEETGPQAYRRARRFAENRDQEYGAHRFACRIVWRAPEPESLAPHVERPDDSAFWETAVPGGNQRYFAQLEHYCRLPQVKSSDPVVF